MRLISVSGAMAWAAILMSASPAGATDPAVAEAQFKKSCGTCHVAAADAAPRQGPNLFGVVGRRAGVVEGFKYSTGLRAGAAMASSGTKARWTAGWPTRNPSSPARSCPTSRPIRTSAGW